MREHCVCGHPRNYHNGEGCYCDPDWCECAFFEGCDGPRYNLTQGYEIECTECVHWLLSLIEEAGV